MRILGTLLLFYEFHDHVAHFVHFADAGEADGALGKSGKRIGDAGFGQGGKLIERVRVRAAFSPVSAR